MVDFNALETRGPIEPELLPAAMLARLGELGASVDRQGEWPREQFELLARHGVLGWVIPRAFGGSGISHRALLAGYLALARACLTTTFILTQRNGASQRIAGSANVSLAQRLLPALARGELAATVGISHLTTSRQHLRLPAVRVAESPGGFRFHGDVPWVTFAPQADFIVTGGTLADGRQVLAAIPATAAGVAIGPPARLLALSASQTAAVHLENVFVGDDLLLTGPVEQVMKHGVGGATGSLATSALAVGLSLAAIDHLRDEATRRPDLDEIVAPLAAEASELEALLDASEENAGGVSAESLRGRSNSLVLRSTQALLAASKGAGFVAGHFAERAVREAMFFLVWSCPQPVVAAALRGFAGLGPCS